MDKRLCVWQSVMLETRLNIRISRCVNRQCKIYLNPVHKEVCESCPSRVPIEGKDEITESIADTVYVELDGRQDEGVEHILSNHCKKCEHYDKKDGLCAMLTCEYPLPMRDLMRNLSIHCPLELW